MNSERRKSGSLLKGEKRSSDRRREPRFSLDSTSLTATFEEQKRQFDELAGEVRGKIDMVKEFRQARADRYSPQSSPRRQTSREEIRGDRKEREEDTTETKKPIKAVTKPRAAPAPAPIPVSAPMPFAAPLPGGMPAPAPAPIPMGFPGGPPIPAPLPNGLSGQVAPPLRPTRRATSAAYLRQSKRLKHHRGRYYRCLTLCQGFIRQFCEPPPNYSSRNVSDMITIYNGLSFKAYRPKPGVPMKPLFWKKIQPNKVERSTFWRNIVEDSRFIDVKRLEDKFQKVEVVRKERVVEEKEEAAPKMHISHSRTFVISVMIKLSRLDVEGLLRPIRAMDDEAVNVRELCSLAPNEQEIEQAMNDMMEMGGDVGALSEVERFWWELCNIPKLKLRMELWLFKLEFEAEVELWEEQLQIGENATHCIMRSERLQVLFSAVLAVGNFLNDGQRRGEAQGVSLDVLLQLEGMRENDSRQTLLTYMHEIIAERAPQALAIEEDLAPLVLMQNFDWPGLDSCRVMGRALADMLALYRREFNGSTFLPEVDMKERDFDDATETDDVDRFDEVMGEFFQTFRERVARLARGYDQLLVDIDTVKQQFWEDRCETDDFFWKWWEFREAWLRTRAQIALRIRKEELQKQREEIKKMRREEARRRREAREAMNLQNDGQPWTYRQTFVMNKEQFKHCSSDFFLSYLQRNFRDYGTLEFDEEEGTLLVVVDDGELQPDAMDILKTYLGKMAVHQG